MHRNPDGKIKHRDDAPQSGWKNKTSRRCTASSVRCGCLSGCVLNEGILYKTERLKQSAECVHIFPEWMCILTERFLLCNEHADFGMKFIPFLCALSITGRGRRYLSSGFSSCFERFPTYLLYSSKY